MSAEHKSDSVSKSSDTASAHSNKLAGSDDTVVYDTPAKNPLAESNAANVIRNSVEKASTASMLTFSPCKFKYQDLYAKFEETIGAADDLIKLDLLNFLDDVKPVDRLNVFTDFLKELVTLRKGRGQEPDESEYLNKYGKDLNHAVKDVFAIGLRFGDGFVGTGYIGEGGMGDIYMATPVLHTRNEIKRAIKLAKNYKLQEKYGSIAQHTGQTFDQYVNDVYLRFMREIEITSVLENQINLRKENVAKAYASGSTAKQELYLALEYIEGWNLSDYQIKYKEKTGKNIPMGAWAYVFSEISKTLEFLHEHIVHRDLKPHNIMIASKLKSIKILDFGIAKFRHNNQDDGFSTAGIQGYKGTPNYSPVEQFISAADVDHRCDLYALGCTMFELLDTKGVPPYSTQIQSMNINQLIQELNSPKNIPQIENENCPKKLQEIVTKLLQAGVSKRIQSAAELSKLLEPFQKRHLFENTIDVIQGISKEVLDDKSRDPDEPGGFFKWFF